MIEAPCYNCEERHELCHATCEHYAEFREKLDAARKARRDAAKLEDYQADAQARMRKKRRK